MKNKISSLFKSLLWVIIDILLIPLYIITWIIFLIANAGENSSQISRRKPSIDENYFRQEIEVLRDYSMFYYPEFKPERIKNLFDKIIEGATLERNKSSKSGSFPESFAIGFLPLNREQTLWLRVRKLLIDYIGLDLT